MRAVVVILTLFVGLALTAAVAWNAAEAHYQNCVLTAQTLPNDGGPEDLFAEQRMGEDPHGKRVYKRVQSCSRLP